MENTYTVGELCDFLTHTISRAFPDEIWVQGEIRDLSRASSGHVYFTLQDPEIAASNPALLPVTLFESDKVAVNRVLSRSGAVRMTDGIQVRIRGRMAYYAPRGVVQLRMTWIDTDFTLGKLAAERERLVKSLNARGLLERNPALPLPLVPLRVGLVTSEGSAAYADFVDELASSRYAWRLRVADTRVQGSDAPAEIAAAIGRAAAADVDVVAVVRGGGAQTDLVAFDSEQVALAIAHCSVPVLTGIGHETDVSVADLAARNFKTPTACAAGLVGLVDGFVERLDRVASSTRRAVSSRLALASTNLGHLTRRTSRSALIAAERSIQRLTDVGRRAGRAASRQLSAAATDIGRLAVSLGPMTRRRIGLAETRLDDAAHRASLLDPNRLLARGWSITRTSHGELVIDPTDVEPGGVLHTTVAGGRITSVVSENGEKRDGRRNQG
ncbi:MAG: exodeoxyribonuclease VII large subunit [Acidimicrobiia bacterium]|nr:exodeoxyribonuclease VII large subunit [Acidimicrobiia bacterium]